MGLSNQDLNQIAQIRNSASIVGTGGFKNLTGTGAHTSLTGYAVVTQEDTVFTVFTVDGVVQLANYGLSSVTVKAGAYLPVPSGSKITAITMSSGSCIIYML
tara:strand:+ start:8736 stop:9041 length:306 start_codon:yes stop_codon:yes gene_type:complete